ncbi:MAG: hypothetical protein K0S48_2762 [Ramlibacter sp.]|jgi:hypothetical protein|nr:hypothetical protein [Ramlibacter sp.]
MTVFPLLRPAPALLFSVALLLTACGGGEPAESEVAAVQAEAGADTTPADESAAAESDTRPTSPDAPTAEADADAQATGTPSDAVAESATGPVRAEAGLRTSSLFSDDLPAAGYRGGSAVPADARAEDVSNPRTVVGTGTARSCTSAAFVRAVARGGVITFNCGPAPVTIVLAATAKIVNDKAKKTVIDGGGKVTLSGGGQRRILYMNTCDPDQVWTTPHCQDQDHPKLTLQNLTFVDGLASGTNAAGADGGGAVFARGGRLKIVNSRFFRNRCDPTGPDVGGGAVRAFDQYQDLPLYVVNSTFGGRSDLANVCSNGGALSSIGVSYSVINSLFTHNKAIGIGANPARPGTPGGGSGGAIYNDGNTFHLQVLGSKLVANKAREGGGAIFFVSNDLTGTLQIGDSVLKSNPSGRFETAGLPGIFYLGSGLAQVSGSTLVP